MTTHNGGKPTTRDVHNYQPPKGPTNIGDGHSPGLHGHNAGNRNCPLASGESGHPGISHENHGHAGSQRPGHSRPMPGGRDILGEF